MVGLACAAVHVAPAGSGPVRLVLPPSTLSPLAVSGCTAGAGKRRANVRCACASGIDASVAMTITPAAAMERALPNGLKACPIQRATRRRVEEQVPDAAGVVVEVIMSPRGKFVMPDRLTFTSPSRTQRVSKRETLLRPSIVDAISVPSVNECVNAA